MHTALTHHELRLAGECAQALEIIWTDLLRRDPVLQFQVRQEPVDQIALDCHRVSVLVASSQDGEEIPLVAPHEWTALQNVVHAIYQQVQLGLILLMPDAAEKQNLAALHRKLLPHLHARHHVQA